MPAEIRDDARNSLIVSGIGEIASFGHEIEPSGEVVSPAQFIPLAEATNMIVPMTRHVIKSTLAMFVGLANRLKLKTTAEGIETEAQCAALFKAGVTCGQGYLVGRPVSLAEFLRTHTEAESKSPPAIQKKAA